MPLQLSLEVCAEQLSTVKAAASLGIKRIELCSALDLGGLTPSVGFIEASCERNIDVHVLIRNRPGDFNYNEHELGLMMRDIPAAKKAGAKGVVFGILNDHNELSTKNKFLTRLARSYGLECTFHRAFDIIENPLENLDTLAEMGFQRVLTSGQGLTAEDGAEMLLKMREKAPKGLQIMAGGGINPQNAVIIKRTGVDAIHFSSRQLIKDELPYKFGPAYKTDLLKMSEMIKVLMG